MQVFNFDSGITFSLLLNSIWHAYENGGLTFKEQFLKLKNHSQGTELKCNWETQLLETLQTTLDEANFTPLNFLSLLKRKCQSLDLIRSSLLGDGGIQIGVTEQSPSSFNDRLSFLVLKHQLKYLDPYELCIYILLDIFREKAKERWLLLPPAIAPDSPEKVFNILAKRPLILKSGVVKISPFLAAVLESEFFDWVEQTLPRAILKFFDCEDPLAPNLKARVFLLKEVDAPELIAVIEANLDDMTSELLAYSLTELLKNKALDYVIVPVAMKKSRCAFQIQVLAKPEDRAWVEEYLLRHTSTFGVRTTWAERKTLKREESIFQSRFGKIRIKTGFLDSEKIRLAPEFEDIVRISQEKGLPALSVYNEIISELQKAEGNLKSF